MYFSFPLSISIPINPSFNKLFLEGYVFNSFVIYIGGGLRGKPSLAKGARHHESPHIMFRVTMGILLKDIKVVT